MYKPNRARLTRRNAERLLVVATYAQAMRTVGVSNDTNNRYRTFHEIVSESLGIRKMCAKLVPKVLTDDQKARRLIQPVNAQENIPEFSYRHIETIVIVNIDIDKTHSERHANNRI
ncbi:hypothetical protein NQ318_011706 [Aromia moschata]|uniref:50S ribosomal protein L22, chloroplastic n=1 Tax=Aromia moschata TaxID=1265417 RepID=A0AAV8XHQ9_9CUCU|nr:hypothetical protein NQ318_011706 [Aromia moschata]